MAREVVLISEARIATVQLLEQVLDRLATTTPLRARSRMLDELSSDDLTPETYPLIVRSFTPEAFRLTRLLTRRGAAYGYYLDDNFWLLDPESEIGQVYAGTRARRRLESIVRRASPVIASTPLLRDYLLPLNPAAIDLESFFDFSLVPTLPERQSPRAVVRGGFAASAHRSQDLRQVIADVVDILERHDDLEFEFIGIDDDVLPAHPRIRHHPYRASYREYIDFQIARDWDFGLAPLGSVPSNMYKTDNKYREYAALGIPGIYQEAPPYRLVRDGDTGLLAGGSRSWRDAIESYLGDPALRERVRHAARRDAEARCSLDTVAPTWGEFFAGMPELDDEPGRTALLRRDLDYRPPLPIRAVLRLGALGRYGVTQTIENGILPTLGRTIRFTGRRLRRDPRRGDGGEGR